MTNSSKPPKAAIEVPTPTGPFEWSFYYSGPRESTPDPKCLGCFQAGGVCPGHWGLVAALDHRQAQLEGAVVLSDFAMARALVLAEPPHPTRTQVQVSLRGSGSFASVGERALVIEMKIL